MTTPTDPTTLRTALERVAALEKVMTFEVIPALKVFAGDNRGVRSLVKRLEALATPAPAADEARCFEGVAALHAGIPTVVTCGELRDSETHEPGAPDYDHPFQPAPTPAPPTPPATGRWVVVQGEDDDCGVCGRAKLRFVDPEYEPGGLRCTECDWFEPHPEGDHEWRRSCGMSCGNEPPTPPATEERVCESCGHERHMCSKPMCDCMAPEPGSPRWLTLNPTQPATEPVAELVEAFISERELDDEDVADLTAIVVAARAEVDVERLARALDAVYSPSSMGPLPPVGPRGLAERIAAAYREVEP